LKEIEEAHEDCLLTILYRHLLTATDAEIHQLIYYLVQQSIFPFLEMLGKWIYYGIIDDKFNEFMIAERTNVQEKRSTNFDWEDRFVFNKNKVPSASSDTSIPYKFM
jgi:gamma-tubulin complex component 2